MGVDINERTNNGEGGSPLWWAEHSLPEDSEATGPNVDAAIVWHPGDANRIEAITSLANRSAINTWRKNK